MELNDFLYSPVPEVKDLAERAVKLKTLYDNKEISQSEYEELSNDLLELKYINTDMVDLEAIRELWQVVDVLKNLKFFASLI
jgi:hypothetical protein